MKNVFTGKSGDSNHASRNDDRNAINLDVLNHSVHPNYDGVSSYYDVAILETAHVNFSRAISPVCLPEKSSDDIHKYDNYQVQLIGWGQKDLQTAVSNQLQRVALKIYTSRSVYIQANMLCEVKLSFYTKIKRELGSTTKK